MKLRCIAIDDEPFALKILADDLLKIPQLEVVDTFSNPLKAIDLIQQGGVDLLFLDIQMPTLLGTRFLRSLGNPPMVIFTTAYEQYALEGYELDVVDYLLKPIRFDRLIKACSKAADFFQQRQKGHTDAPNDTFFFIFSEYKQIKVYDQDVLYVEGLKDYVKIFLTSQPYPILTRLNMKAIEAKLDPNQFCRVHQSYIVPLRRITSFQKTKLMVSRSEGRSATSEDTLLGSIPLGGTPPSQTEIPIGERYAEEFLVRYRGK